MTVGERVAALQTRISEAARRAGREPEAVALVAVCKRQPFDRIWAAYEAGLRHFGENTAQGLKATAQAFSERGAEVRWHFVGGLQRNKVNAVMPYQPLVHSIDRMSLAEALSQRAAGELDVLVQVNVGSEAQKSGVDPDGAVELSRAVAELPNLRLRGLMAIPPADEDPTPHFQTLFRLGGEVARQPGCEDATELSMGMSEDFEEAIACGATLVRVGTALFGPRDA